MRTHRLMLAMGVMVLATTGLVWAQAPAAADIPDKPLMGYDALARFDLLPLLGDSVAYQDSSCSRQNINDDAGHYLYYEINGQRVDALPRDPNAIKKTDVVECVMVDTDGPGVITRMWSTGVTGRVPLLQPGTRVKFYFDGEKTPRLDLTAGELFGQKGAKWPFVMPLSRTFESGNNDLEGPASICYVPLPFAKHIKITTTNLYFYHFDHLKYPAGTPIESFTMAQAEKNRAALEKAAQMFLDRGELPNPPAELSVSPGSVTIGAGQTAVLFEGTGPAIVRSLKVKLQQAQNINLRGLVLQVQYDGSGVNSVDVPLGDFFGMSASSDTRYRSMPLGSTEAGYYCYFPMPYRKSVKIQVVNETAAPVSLYKSVGVQKVSALPAAAGYFHAAYHQDKNPVNRDKAKGLLNDYNILTVEGARGKYVGCSMFMQGAIGTESISFLEGDETIYVDDETKWPTHWTGTGTEDYFNGSYYWNGVHREDMDGAFGGLTCRDDSKRRITCYRWHVTDYISFQKRVKVDIEHGGESDFPCDYASTAYYYLDKALAAPKLPALADRIRRTEDAVPYMAGCKFVQPYVSDAGTKVDYRPMRKVDPEWWTEYMPEGISAPSMQIFCSAKEVGEKISGKIFLPGDDYYDVSIFMSVGPTYGKFAMFLNDGNTLRHVGNFDAYNETFLPYKEYKLGRMLLKGGEREMVFQMIGKHEMATGMDLGVASMWCISASPTVRPWMVIGPWPCPKEGGWAVANPPEKELNFKAEYAVDITRQGKPVKATNKWSPIMLGPGGGVSSQSIFGWDSWQECYGVTFVWSPKDQSVGALMAKDDALAMWVNGAKVFDSNTWSMYASDICITSCPLKKGWNTILCKNGNWDGAWAWSLKFTDPNQELKFSNDPAEAVGAPGVTK